MEEKLNREYFDPQAATFNYNVTGGGDSASGGSGGSGMECLQLRSQPGPFHYLISEQAKSLVALQELQNEVGALLEFRDLVIETFPNLRSKMAPSTPASGTRRDWEPGVRVRRKLAGGGQDAARAKPQPSVQDSGFSTETSCGKDAHSSASASASATRSRPLEDELWALLDVIQRKGGRLRDEAELLRGELDERTDTADTEHTAEEEFTRALSAPACDPCGACGSSCGELQRLRHERDLLLARAAQLEAAALAGGAPGTAPGTATSTPGRAAASLGSPLGRLDAPLDTPARPPRVPTPDSRKFAAILLESNPVELQRQLLTSTVQNQVLSDRMKRVLEQRTLLLERLDRARDVNEDLKFRLEEKSIELEGARARVRQLEGARNDERRDAHSSMRDMEPLPLPDERLERYERHERLERSERYERHERLDRSHRSAASERNDDDDDARISETPRRGRPSRIPLHTAHKGAAPRPPPAPSAAPSAAPPRPPSAHSAHSARSARSSASARSRAGEARRRDAPAADSKTTEQASEDHSSDWERYRDSSLAAAAEYVSRVSRLAPLVQLAPLAPLPPLPRPAPLLTPPPAPPAPPAAPHAARSRPLPLAPRAYSPPLPLAAELARSLLYDNSLDDATTPDSLWNGKPQQYFESINCADADADADGADDDYDSDSLAP